MLLAPAGLIQWLLVAELRAVIFDEGRYRKMLAMIMSPKELIEPESFRTGNSNPIFKIKRGQSTIRRYGDDFDGKQKNKIEYGQKSSRRLGLNTKRSVLFQKPMLLSLSVDAVVSNFQSHSREIEKLDFLDRALSQGEIEHTFSPRGNESRFIQPA